MAVGLFVGCRVLRAFRFIDVSKMRIAPQILIALELVGLMIGILILTDDAGFLSSSVARSREPLILLLKVGESLPTIGLLVDGETSVIVESLGVQRHQPLNQDAHRVLFPIGREDPHLLGSSGLLR